MKKAYLVLSDGTVYEGYSFGAEAQAIGELVCNSGVAGYLETLTDPACAGQIVLETFPLIGNYGVIEEDFEGKCSLRGYVVCECCDAPSNFRSQYDLDSFLKKNGVPGICGVDTRAITRRIRDLGAVNAMICAEVPDDLSAISAYAVSGEVEKTSCKERQFFPADGEAKHSAAVIDYGMRACLVRELRKRGCDVTVYPANTAAEDILSGQHDGVLLSGGPGDPAENSGCIAEIAKLIGKIPVFGVGLGHQMAAIALGARTERMQHGHRGSSQPVKDLTTGNIHITGQNHGYAVIADSVKMGEIRFVNANDGSCEGIVYPELNAITVQFNPDAKCGPKDTSFLFDRFISMMGGEKLCR